MPHLVRPRIGSPDSRSCCPRRHWSPIPYSNDASGCNPSSSPSSSSKHLRFQARLVCPFSMRTSRPRAMRFLAMEHNHLSMGTCFFCNASFLILNSGCLLAFQYVSEFQGPQGNGITRQNGLSRSICSSIARRSVGTNRSMPSISMSVGWLTGQPAAAASAVSIIAPQNISSINVLHLPKLHKVCSLFNFCPDRFDHIFRSDIQRLAVR